jgi:hypothetical protein
VTGEAEVVAVAALVGNRVMGAMEGTRAMEEELTTGPITPAVAGVTVLLATAVASITSNTQELVGKVATLTKGATGTEGLGVTSTAERIAISGVATVTGTKNLPKVTMMT